MLKSMNKTNNSIEQLKQRELTMTNLEVNKSDNKATIFFESSFMGTISAIQVRNYTVNVGKYAQYDRCPLVRYTEKGKQKKKGFRKTSNPFIFIIEGHHTMDLESLAYNVTDSNGYTSKESKYPCFDQRYIEDFNAFISDYLDAHGVEVLFDGRGQQAIDDACNKVIINSI